MAYEDSDYTIVIDIMHALTQTYNFSCGNSLGGGNTSGFVFPYIRPSDHTVVIAGAYNNYVPKLTAMAKL